MKHLYKNLYVSGQLKACDFEQLSEAGIKTIINNRPDDEEQNQLSAEEAAKLAQQHNINYHYLPMANGQPLPPTLVSDFRTIMQSSEGDVLAHCRSGMRSSFIWALGELPNGEITVDQAINAAQEAGIPLGNARPVLENVAP